ncbi:unnamed protein product [Oikopleura dioica]|uniref:Uncharacterized protein n=1 Tax=Oikopleura dioica TaxID=34765 RepID=E4XBK1_OIKDI|nr:unnamed protein product [Oikopleura dioica]
MKLFQILSAEIVSGFIFGAQRSFENSDLAKECWSCHEKSFEECWLKGELKSCEAGACTIDVQYRAKAVQVVQAGCSSLNTCVANVKQNFGSFRGEISSLANPNLHQCKIFSQNIEQLNSVCRTCCTDSKCNHGWLPTEFHEWRNIDTNENVDPFSDPFSIDMSIFKKEQKTPMKKTQVKVFQSTTKTAPNGGNGFTKKVPRSQLSDRLKTSSQKSQDMRFSLNVDKSGRVMQNYRGIKTLEKTPRRDQMRKISSTRAQKSQVAPKPKVAVKLPIKKTLPRLSAVASSPSTPTTKRPGPWSHLPQWKINQLRRLRQRRLEAKRLEEESKSA